MLACFLFWPACHPLLADGKGKVFTEKECALHDGAEIIWDLRKYQWVCCIPQDEDLEECIPIVDKKPLPKSSIKPLVRGGMKTIIKE